MAKIGFIGAGKMGLGVVSNLLKNGHALTVHQRSETSHATSLSGSGVALVPDAMTCVAGQDLVFLCLPSMASWTEMAEVVRANATTGSVVVDLTSASPQASRDLHRALATTNVGFVDAPMLKGPKAAADAEIQLLVGGTEVDINRCMPLLKEISEAQYLTGAPGSGHVLKLLNNAVTLTNSAIVYEAFALAAHLGVDLSMVHRAMDASAASSKRLNAIAPILMSGTHPPSFDVSVALKDLELYCEMARDAGSVTFSGSAARDLYRLGHMVGLADEPVTRLADMMFDLMAGRAESLGKDSSISKRQEGQD